MSCKVTDNLNISTTQGSEEPKSVHGSRHQEPSQQVESMTKQDNMDFMERLGKQVSTKIKLAREGDGHTVEVKTAPKLHRQGAINGLNEMVTQSLQNRMPPEKVEGRIAGP
jgi:hypothetical protein